MIIISILAFGFTSLNALDFFGLKHNSSLNELNIKTSAECSACKTTIEKSLKSEKGVKSASLDLSSKIVKVEYDPAVTSPQMLKTTIAGLGYDADEVKATQTHVEIEKENCCGGEQAAGGCHK